MNDLWQETVERWARQVEAERRKVTVVGGEVPNIMVTRGFLPSVETESAKPMFCAGVSLPAVPYYSETTEALKAELATAKRDVEALGCKLTATMTDMGSLQAECQRLRAAAEEQGREAVVTDSEQVADQMRQDILGGKIDGAGRQVVRKAIDQMDAPPTGRTAQDGALGNISRRGGF
jgi:hypothetical protein